MNKEQVKGVAKEVAGKIQKNAGKIVDSKNQQMKGLQKESAGIIEKKVGDAQETIKKSSKNSRY